MSAGFKSLKGEDGGHRIPGGRMMLDWEKFYDSYPRGFGPTEYLRQAGHTINGEPINSEQFEIILDRMEEMLAYNSGIAKTALLLKA